MALDRALLLQEPGLVEIGASSGVYVYSKGDITVEPIISRFDLPTSQFGVVDSTRMSDRMFRVKFTPVGEWENLSALFPYFATAAGASIYGSSDTALIVWTRSGKKLTLHNCRVTKLPNIRMAVNQTLLGEVEFTAILANSTAPTDAAAYFTLATGQTYPGDAAFSASAIKTLAYASAWGSSPWDAFFTSDGWEINFDLSLRPDYVDSHGTVDMKFVALKVNAKAAPMGPTLAQVQAALSTTSAFGAAISGNHLNISASGVYVRLYNAIMTGYDAGFGQRNTVGPCTWEATRSFTAGAPDALAYVGTSAPA